MSSNTASLVLLPEPTIDEARQLKHGKLWKDRNQCKHATEGKLSSRGLEAANGYGTRLRILKQWARAPYCTSRDMGPMGLGKIGHSHAVNPSHRELILCTLYRTVIGLTLD